MVLFLLKLLDFKKVGGLFLPYWHNDARMIGAWCVKLHAHILDYFRVAFLDSSNSG